MPADEFMQFLSQASAQRPGLQCTEGALKGLGFHAGEHGGLKLTANARAALMQRLSGVAGSGANTTPLGAPALGMPGQCASSAEMCIQPLLPLIHALHLHPIEPTDLGVLIADALGPLPGPPAMVPAGTVVMSAGAQALAMEQGILGPSSPIPTQCLLLKNMFDPKE